MKKNSGAKVVLGGVHATSMPRFIMRQNKELIDCLVYGEGEITMLEVIDAYENGRPLDAVKGVVFSRNGEIIQTEPRPFIEDMDSIPYPARELIPQHLFLPNLHNVRHKNCLTILTSRGCPFNCSFCAARVVSGRKYRMHSVDYVVDEIKMLVKDYNARQLLFTDDTFTLNKERLVGICEGIIKNRLKIDWFCFSQVGRHDDRIFKIDEKSRMLQYRLRRRVFR